MAFAAVYALVAPLALATLALWHPFHVTGINTIREWQTLIGGILALLGAAFGGYVIWNQTEQIRKIEADRLLRKHAAARAVMPLALMAAIHYAERAASGLEALRGASVGHRIRAIPGQPFNPPEMDSMAIDPLRDVIESGTPPLGLRVGSLISDIQIMAARLSGVAEALRGGSSRIVVSSNLDDYILTAALIHARASSLFNYARLDIDEPPTAYPSYAELKTSLDLMHFDASTHERLYEMALQRATRNNGG